MKVDYSPTGVCSKLMTIETDDSGIIINAEVVGGCNGNLKGICSLIRGMAATDAVQRLRGIECGTKGTSCPDQMSKALEQLIDLQRKA